MTDKKKKLKVKLPSKGDRALGAVLSSIFSPPGQEVDFYPPETEARKVMDRPCSCGNPAVQYGLDGEPICKWCLINGEDRAPLNPDAVYERMAKSMQAELLDVLNRYPTPEGKRLGIETMLALLAGIVSQHDNPSEARNRLVSVLDIFIAANDSQGPN